MRRIVFFWNDENRLTVAEKANEKKVEFVYDGLGRMRIVKTYSWISDAWVRDSEKHLAYDGNLIIAELDGTDALVNSYLWGLSLSGGIDGAGGVGGLLIADMNGTKEFPAYDGNGNVTAYTDSSGNILSKQLYSPFGALVSKEGTSSSPFLFSTIYYEPNTELYCYLYRKYIPSLARWLNRDPTGEKGGMNLYGMAGNNAVNKVDVLGFFTSNPLIIAGDDQWYDPQTGYGKDGDKQITPSPSRIIKTHETNSRKKPKCCERPDAKPDNCVYHVFYNAGSGWAQNTDNNYISHVAVKLTSNSVKRIPDEPIGFNPNLLESISGHSERSGIVKENRRDVAYITSKCCYTDKEMIQMRDFLLNNLTSKTDTVQYNDSYWYVNGPNCATFAYDVNKGKGDNSIHAPDWDRSIINKVTVGILGGAAARPEELRQAIIMTPGTESIYQNPEWTGNWKNFD